MAEHLLPLCALHSGVSPAAGVRSAGFGMAELIAEVEKLEKHYAVRLTEARAAPRTNTRARI